MRFRLATASLLLLAATALSGCGQKGPLFLPQPKPTVTTPAPGVSTAKPATSGTVVAPASAVSGSG